jgi:Flp pilus assembly protein TadG
MPILSKPTSLLRRLISRREGNISIMFGLAAIPLIVSVGMGIDISRAYSVRTRLNAALDDAGLALGASPKLCPAPAPCYTQAQLDQRLRTYVIANFPAGKVGSIGTPSFTISANGLQYTITGTASVNTTLMRIIGINTLSVAATSVISKGVGLELAMALDNTGSMLSNNNIATLRTASQQLIDDLFAKTTSTSQLKISIVPYVTAVNLPQTLATQAGILATAAPFAYDTTQTDDTKWKGCVMEPQYPADMAEGTTQWPAAYLWDIYDPAVNDTTVWPHKSTAASDNVTKKPDGTSNVHTTFSNAGGLGDCNMNAAVNKDCPTQIVPLTNDQAALDAAVQAMQGWCQSGTMINVGMAWAWRTISPNSVFNNAAFTTVPQPYGAPGWIKAVILMTDGQDVVFQGCDETYSYTSANGGASPFFSNKGQSPTCLRGNGDGAVNPPPASGMTPYGRLLGNGLHSKIGKGVPDPATGGSPSLGAVLNGPPPSPPDVSNGKELIDAEVAIVCANMKATNPPVVIYTIGFTGAAANSLAMLNQCSTDNGGGGGNGPYYYAAPDQASLTAAFSAIAQSLNQLRIAQ